MSEDRKQIVIVGGVAGGASAAARARRLSEDAEIILFERGEYISFANCGLPYHIGGTIADRSRLLVQTKEKMHQRFNIDIRIRSEVTGIDRTAKLVHVHDLETDKRYTQSYDKVILSPGAEPIALPIKGADCDRVMTLRNLADMDAINRVIGEAHAGSAAIIGGGYIGLEMAENLVHRGVSVSVIELAGQVMGAIDPEMAAMVNEELTEHGVVLHLNNSVTAIDQDDRSLSLTLSDGQVVPADFAVFAVGVRPEVTLARDCGLDIGERGGIVVDDTMRTSDPDIYAVGDAVEVEDFVGGDAALIPLAGPANRQARIAVDTIFGRDAHYRKTQGTAIVKVFDLAAATTGMNEKHLKRLKRSYEKIYVHPSSHASYYPGASQISLKLLFDPDNGNILGAQAVGTDGVDKRIDVIATALRAGMTVFDLEHLELCYAPPYGSAKDPVNYAGFVAGNAIDGLMPICQAADAANPRDDQIVLDVRTEDEVKMGTIPGAINIPIDDLRGRLNELPRDKEILVSCAVGQRGYIGTRILLQHGVKARNLTGGFKTYRTVYPTTVGHVAQERKEMTDDTGQDAAVMKNTSEPLNIVTHLDARGLQCPGPVMRIRETLNDMQDGQALTVTSTDPGFAADMPAWCHASNHTFAGIANNGAETTVTIVKGSVGTANAAAAQKGGGKTIVVFSNDFDRAMASFIIANGAASTGRDVTLFFTFWGLNLLRKHQGVPVKKNLVERMFGMMMPRGARKVKLSKMHMAGMGTAMMKAIMKKKQVLSLPELIDAARANGVRLVACTMTMDLMGIKAEELIDGVEYGGVAMYLDKADDANVYLFI